MARARLRRTRHELRVLLGRLALAAAGIAAGAVHAAAQQTIFNVPSSDVLEPSTIYLESDWYARPWDRGSGRTALTTVRGVYGVGGGLESGVNVGSFDLLSEGAPFADAAIKWRPPALQADAAGLYAGTHAGIGLGGATNGMGRSLTYGAAYAKLAGWGTRLGAGPYFATRRVFGRERGGMLATLEQTVPGLTGLTAAADWFSGRGGYATVGSVYNRAPLTWYLGYGFANAGRKDDLLAIELGITFAARRVTRR